jgi:hypothetical protein
MTLEFCPVALDTQSPDREARMVYREGRLLAVLSCFSEIHGGLSGCWFIEANFGDLPTPDLHTFKGLDEFAHWLGSR